MSNYYDEDDYEGDGLGDQDLLDMGFEEFTDIEIVDDIDCAFIDRQLFQTEKELSAALAAGDLGRAERLQDEIELLVMAVH
jgi:hypothetical protein